MTQLAIGVRVAERGRPIFFGDKLKAERRQMLKFFSLLIWYVLQIEIPILEERVFDTIWRNSLRSQMAEISSILTMKAIAKIGVWNVRAM